MKEKLAAMYFEINDGLITQAEDQKDLLEKADLALARAQKISRLVEDACNSGDLSASPDIYEPVIFSLHNFLQEAIDSVHETMNWLYSLECSVSEYAPDGMHELTDTEKLAALQGLVKMKGDIVKTLKMRREQAIKAGLPVSEEQAEAEIQLPETA